MYYKHQLGQKGESIAANFLQSQGYDFIARNYHCPFGEIDLIAEKDGELIFFEVKTRFDDSEIPAVETVNYLKQKKLIRSAQCYLSQRKLFDTPWRIDVLGIELNSNGTLKDIEHLKGAVEEW